MMCDVIIAAENARFGQPEISLGITSRAGGTQRLARAVGKAQAMDMVLTGRLIDAASAERAGLVSRVVPTETLIDETMAIAERVASMSLPAARAAAVDHAFESTLTGGIAFERPTFHTTFAHADRTEGMTAFLAKRPPAFQHG